MSCDNIGSFVIRVLALIVIADILILFAEMKRQDCDRIDEKQKKAAMDALKKEIADLRLEIESLTTS